MHDPSAWHVKLSISYRVFFQIFDEYKRTSSRRSWIMLVEYLTFVPWVNFMTAGLTCFLPFFPLIPFSYSFFFLMPLFSSLLLSEWTLFRWCPFFFFFTSSTLPSRPLDCCHHHFFFLPYFYLPFFFLSYPIPMLQRTRTHLHRHADCQSAVLMLPCTSSLFLCATYTHIHTHYHPYSWLFWSSVKDRVWGWVQECTWLKLQTHRGNARTCTSKYCFRQVLDE